MPGRVDERTATSITEAEADLGGDPIARAPQHHVIVTREIHIPVTAMYHEVDEEGDVSVVHGDGHEAGHEAARRRREARRDQACAAKADHEATVCRKALLVADLHETTLRSGENDPGHPDRTKTDDDQIDVVVEDNAMHPLDDLAQDLWTDNLRSQSEGGILHPGAGQQNVEGDPREVHLQQDHAAHRGLGAIAADGMIAQGRVEVQGATKAAAREVVHRTIQMKAGVEIDARTAFDVIKDRLNGANRLIGGEGTVLQLPLARDLVEN